MRDFSVINRLLIILLILTISGCKNTTKSELTPLLLQLIPTHVSVFGATDGSIDLTVTGGDPPFQYQWSNGATTEDIGNISVGIYCITVSDLEDQIAIDSISIRQPNETSSITDIDGNVYKTVKIGSQWWMAENLKITIEPNGESILSSDNGIYGRSYTWEVVMNRSIQPKARGISPEGWHIPDEDEYKTLFEELGGIAVAGGKMKEMGTEHWRSPNTGATNSSGFNALPDPFGGEAFEYTHFLCSSGGGDNVILPSLKFNGIDAYIINWVDTDNFLNTTLHSVRCIKD